LRHLYQGEITLAILRVIIPLSALRTFEQGGIFTVPHLL
jgi:hypothetical protein